MDTVPEKTDFAQSEAIAKLIGFLDSDKGYVRKNARLALVDYGKASVPPLIEALEHPSPHVRWEAAKALVELADASAAEALTRALMDKDIQVQWLAAEALIALGRWALPPILRALLADFGSAELRRGAHHVLHDLKKAGWLTVGEKRLLAALDIGEPEAAVPLAARAALEELREEG